GVVQPGFGDRGRQLDFDPDHVPFRPRRHRDAHGDRHVGHDHPHGVGIAHRHRERHDDAAERRPRHEPVRGRRVAEVLRPERAREQSSLVFTISGGTGDADLYVRFNALPTTTTFNCRPFLSGNSETCTFTSPAAGPWYVMIRGFAAYSGVTLKGTYTA